MHQTFKSKQNPKNFLGMYLLNFLETYYSILSLDIMFPIAKLFFWCRADLAQLYGPLHPFEGLLLLLA